jgi:hypothetical protein
MLNSVAIDLVNGRGGVGGTPTRQPAGRRRYIKTKAHRRDAAPILQRFAALRTPDKLNGLHYISHSY